MSSSIDYDLVACSAMVKPARLLTFYKLRTWIDQVVKVVVHTFVVDASKLPLSEETPRGYWYCAGDFCDIDEGGVRQHLTRANLDYARCLVAPDIKDDHPERSQLVIAGDYGVHYVCHNITNRVLYATNLPETLIDLDIATTGYELVVKSTLGVYGQNKVEWEQRKSGCQAVVSHVPPSQPQLALSSGERPIRTREAEIHKIHLRAAGGKSKVAKDLTYALEKIDNEFLSVSESLVQEFDSQKIDYDRFATSMLNACIQLFTQSIRTVGLEMTTKIYPGCNLDVVESMEEGVSHTQVQKNVVS